MPQDELVRDHFDRMGQDGSYAAFYADRGLETHDFFARRDRVEEGLLRYIKPGQRVLDVGCGTGPMVEFLCKHELQYAGVDVAQGMLDSITQRFARTPYSGQIELKIGTSASIPYPDGSFDILIGMGLLEYLEDMRPSLDEFKRVLKPGGIAVLTMPHLHSVNRFVVRNARFLTATYDVLRRITGRPIPERDGIVHKELTPAGLDRFVRAAGFESLEKSFYDFKLVFYPFSRILPGLAYAINRRVENRGPGILANGFIGFYRKLPASSK